MTDNILNDDSPRAGGSDQLLPVVLAQTGTPSYVDLAAAHFEKESEVRPVTIRISEARLAIEVQGQGAGRSNDVYQSIFDPTFPIDFDYSNIKAVVEWRRGNANFALECDPGAVLVVEATSVRVSARVELAFRQRKMSASISIGGVPGMHARPVFTTTPVAVHRFPSDYHGPYDSPSRVYVPPFARSFRLGSLPPGQSLATIDDWAFLPNTAMAVYTFQTLSVDDVIGALGSMPPILVTDWSEEHEIPAGTNNLLVQPVAVHHSAYGQVRVRFSLAV